MQAQATVQCPSVCKMFVLSAFMFAITCYMHALRYACCCTLFKTGMLYMAPLCCSAVHRPHTCDSGIIICQLCKPGAGDNNSILEQILVVAMPALYAVAHDRS